MLLSGRQSAWHAWEALGSIHSTKTKTQLQQNKQNPKQKTIAGLLAIT